MPPQSPPSSGICDEAKDELAFIAREAHSKTVVFDLRQALNSGGPTGDVGSLKTHTIDIHRLSAAIVSATEAIQADASLPQEVTELLMACKFIARLRQAVLDDDWAAVDAIVTEVRNVVTTDDPDMVGKIVKVNYAVHELVQWEVGRIDLEIVSRNVDARLRHALLSGRPTGQVGQLSFNAVSVHELDSAIAFAMAAPRITSVSAVLLSTAKLVRNLRACLMETPVNWPGVQALLPDIVDAGSSKEIDMICWPEIELVQEELGNTEVCGALRAAIGSGGVTGDVDHVDVSSADVSGLEAGLQAAAQFGCSTTVARRLALSALLLFRLRDAAIAGQWSFVRDVIEDCSGISDAFPSELDVRSLLHFTKPSVSLSSSSSSKLSSPSKAFSTAPIPLSELPIVPECKAEVRLIVDAGNDRVVCDLLLSAITHDCATGTVDDFNTSALSTAKLSQAISTSATIGCATQRARSLLATAQLLRRLRQCVIDGAWSDLEREIEDSKAKLVVPEATDEITLIRQVADDEHIARAVINALRSQSAAVMLSFTAGAVAVLTASDAGAIRPPPNKPAKPPGPPPPAAAKPIVMVKPPPPKPATPAPPGPPRPAVIVFNKPAVPKPSASSAVAVTPAPAGDAESVPVPGPASSVPGSQTLAASATSPSVTPQFVQAGLSIAAVAERCKSAKTIALLGVLESVDALRTALSNADWTVVESTLPQLTEVRVKLPSDCVTELTRICVTASNKVAIHALREALSSECITGAVGKLNLIGLSTAKLHAAIAKARKIDDTDKQPDLTRLLNTAVSLLSLRQCVASERWDDIAAIAETVSASQAAVECEAEVSLVLRELADRQAFSKLSQVMQAMGSLRDVIVDSRRVDIVTPLSQAIDNASALSEMSPRTFAALRIARTVLPLRQAVAASNWQAVTECFANDGLLVKLYGLSSVGASAISSGAVDYSSVDVLSVEFGSMVGWVEPEFASYRTHVQVRLSCLAIVQALQRNSAKYINDYDFEFCHMQSAQLPSTEHLAEFKRRSLAAGDQRTSPSTQPRVLSVTDAVRSKVCLRTSDVVAADLESALTAARTLVQICRHSVLDALILVADGALRLRKAVIAGDWESTEELSQEVVELLRSMEPGSEQSTAASGVKRSVIVDKAVDDAVPAAITLVRMEATACLRGVLSSRLANQLVDAMRCDCTVGDIGQLDTSNVQVGALDAAVRAVLSCVSRLKWVWTSDGKSPVVHGDGDGDDDGDDDAYAASIPIASIDSVSELQSGVSSVLPASLRKLLTSAIVLRDVRLGLLTNDWSVIDRAIACVSLLKLDLAQSCSAEYALIRATLQHRTIIHGPLRASLLSGGPIVNMDGSVDLSSVSLGELDEAIAKAAQLGTSTAESKAMYGTALLIRQMRAALLKQDWRGLTRLLCDTVADDLVDIVHEEYNAYRVLCAAHCIHKDLLAAVSNSGDGGVRWRPISAEQGQQQQPPNVRDGLEAYVDPAAIKLTQLDDAIDQAQRFGERVCCAG